MNRGSSGAPRRSRRQGGAWVVDDAKGGDSGFLHIGADGVEPGAFPAPPNQNASVRDLAIEAGERFRLGGRRGTFRPQRFRSGPDGC